MRKLTDLTVLFTAVALIEVFYFAATILPPALLRSATGWELSPDGHWLAKLLSVSLLSQAAIAWTLRAKPPVAVARVLAFYQLASATVDGVVWLTIDGVFSTELARAGVALAIPSHALLGVLLLVAAARARDRR